MAEAIALAITSVTGYTGPALMLLANAIVVVAPATGGARQYRHAKARPAIAASLKSAQ